MSPMSVIKQNVIPKVALDATSIITGFKPGELKAATLIAEKLHSRSSREVILSLFLSLSGIHGYLRETLGNLNLSEMLKLYDEAYYEETQTVEDEDTRLAMIAAALISSIEIRPTKDLIGDNTAAAIITFADGTQTDEIRLLEYGRGIIFQRLEVHH